MAKKKSVLTTILNVLVILLFLVLVAAGALIGFLYFKFQINIVDTIDQIGKLNRDVDVATLVTNGCTQNDYDSINEKIDAASHNPGNLLNFTDRELCAYLNQNLDVVADLKIGAVTLDLSNCGLQVLQIKLSNIDLKQPSEHYCDLNVVLKINSASLKNQTMNSFPANLLKDLIPNELYISVDCSIDEVAGKYTVTPSSIKVNNLSYEDTKSFLRSVNQLIPFTTAETLNQNLATVFADALLGENGMYGRLNSNGATGYGWRSENEFVVYFVDIHQTYHIDYDDDSHGVENSNITTYTIRNDTIFLDDLFDHGYDFLGWYDNAACTGTRIETIDASTLQDYTLYAKWEVIHYTISCDLRGGKIGTSTEYSVPYTIEDATFSLSIDAFKAVNESVTLEFAGWFGEDLTAITKVVTIAQGSYGDRHYAAYYEGEEVNLTLVVDGVTINTASVETGTVLYLNDINNLVKSKLSGYSINAWYTDDELSNAYEYGHQLVMDQTIYATSTYLTNGVYFYPYLNLFADAVANSSVLEINSREMLIAYIDYCIFYDVTNDHVKLLLKYNLNGNSITQEINQAISERDNRDCFVKAYGYGRGADWTYGYYYITQSDATTIAQNHFGGNVYTQQDYALRVDDLNVRADDYDDFEIKFVGKTLRVSTTEQLVWALENGYQPVCDNHSPAKDIYTQAQQVLRDICTDEMSDIEKLHAIYQWLALNVNYDQEALTEFETLLEAGEEDTANAMARTYDSWYAEGVFNYGKAVCEGYAKALVILARLEGIPAVCVSGNGHMWNKVYLDGIWYGIDATHGDLGLKSNKQEIFTNLSFLFTDTFKTSQGYTADNYIDFVADTAINSYDYITFTYTENAYDLFIDNQAELNALINSVSGFRATAESSFYTLEVAVAVANQDNFVNWFNHVGSGWSIITFTTGSRKIDSYGNVIYMLRHNN
ncbi:MAG: InlB B-repeat-containing protein [Clostridia bacterium]|nr:InlB B-repeat-containing protein [Clostridia bacterium]